MAKEKYVAYVGTYTHTNSVGIHVYDVNPETGVFCEKAVAPINNPSYVTISKDGKHLYSIEDEGVAAFNILPDGNLEKVNQNWIGGMRGDYIDVDSKNRFLFVGGFHDGRVTMMKLAEDGSIGNVAFGLFHQSISLGGNERHLDHAKVTCVKLTPAAMPSGRSVVSRMTSTGFPLAASIRSSSASSLRSWMTRML